jgi:type IV pilus assembly protein PilC
MKSTIPTLERPSLFQKEITFGKIFPDKIKENLYTEFSSLLDSGIDIQRTLTILIEEQEKKRPQQKLEEIQSMLIMGSSLSEALQKSGEFSAYEYQSIRIGEESGKLKQVLESLSTYFSNKVKLKRQLISVFSYPVFVISITFGVLYFMLNSVVPMFEEVFKQFGEDLPWLTQKIVWLSNKFSMFMLLFVTSVSLFTIYFYTQRKEIWFRQASSTFLMKIPVLGQLIKKIYLARFCQSMGLLISSKTPLVQSLELIEEMIGFYPIEKGLQSARKEILRGSTLNESLSKFTIFDRRMISLIKIGEEINQLDKTFERLAKQNNDDIEYQTKLMGTIIEPAIIVLIGGIVGIIMVAMYLPMFNLSNVIK